MESLSSFEERMASLHQQLRSEAAQLQAAASPDPRRPKVSVLAAAAKASLAEKMVAQRGKLAVPDTTLATARSLAEQTLPRREQLKALKNNNRDLESQLQQALSIKLRKESEYKCVTESISNAAAMNEKLKISLMELSNKRDTYAAVITDQFQDVETREAKANEDAKYGENLEAALSWFHKFLGLQVIAGEEGVKFVFDEIDTQAPEKEYSLCIKIDNDTYNLVQCDLPIKDFAELVKDLNVSGDLLKFLKVAREKFQSSSVNGDLPLSSAACPDVPSLPFSPPMTTTVNGTSGDVPLVPFSPPVTMPVNRTSGYVPSQSNSQSKNKRLPAKRKGTAPSPGSVRRSPRFEVWLQQKN